MGHLEKDIRKKKDIKYMTESYCTKDKRYLVYLGDGKSMPKARYIAGENPDICGELFDGCEVHHINKNSVDDRPENLIVLSKEEHHKVHGNPVDVFFKDKYIGRYMTVQEAEEDLHLHPSVISYYVKHGKPISSTWKDWRFYVFH